MWGKYNLTFGQRYAQLKVTYTDIFIAHIQYVFSNMLEFHLK